MARSVWKGPFVDGYLLKKAEKVRESAVNEVIKTWSRRSTIMPQFVGLTFGVYNGRSTFRCWCPKTWSATSSANSRRPGPITATAPTRRRRGSNHGQAEGVSRLADNEARRLRACSASARKAQPGCGCMIRGKKVDKALADLTFSRKRIASTSRRRLMSAIANAENNHDLDIDNLVVAEAYVGKSSS
jgi:hypothetical protein